jgi:hypothetical protein
LAVTTEICEGVATPVTGAGAGLGVGAGAGAAAALELLPQPVIETRDETAAAASRARPKRDVERVVLNKAAFTGPP